MVVACEALKPTGPDYRNHNIQQQLEGIVNVVDKSDKYDGFKDFNEFLTSTRYDPSPVAFKS